MGGTGGEAGGLPTRADALDGWVMGRERGGGICGGLEEGMGLGRQKTHMGYYQEAYDAECVAMAIARPSGGSGEGQATKARQSPQLH